LRTANLSLPSLALACAALCFAAGCGSGLSRSSSSGDSSDGGTQTQSPAQTFVAENPETGTIYLLVPGTNATIHEYDAAGANDQSHFSTGLTSAHAIAVDGTTGFVFVSHDGSPGVSAFDPNHGGAAAAKPFGPSGAGVLGAAAGNVCAAGGGSTTVSCLTDAGNAATPLDLVTGSSATSVAMIPQGGMGVAWAFAYTASDATVHQFALPGGAGRNVMLPLAPDAATASPSPHPIAALGNDPYTSAGITVAVTGLSGDGAGTPTVVLIDGTTLTFGKAPLPGAVSLLAADPTHHGFVAAYEDTAAKLTRFVSISNANGPVALSSTTNAAATSMVISSDGNRIILGGGPSPVVLDNK